MKPHDRLTLAGPVSFWDRHMISEDFHRGIYYGAGIISERYLLPPDSMALFRLAHDSYRTGRVQKAEVGIDLGKVEYVSESRGFCLAPYDVVRFSARAGLNGKNFDLVSTDNVLVSTDNVTQPILLSVSLRETLDGKPRAIISLPELLGIRDWSQTDGLTGTWFGVNPPDSFGPGHLNKTWRNYRGCMEERLFLIALGVKVIQAITAASMHEPLLIIGVPEEAQRIKKFMESELGFAISVMATDSSFNLIVNQQSGTNYRNYERKIPTAMTS